MFFEENILVCNINKCSEYAMGFRDDMYISFGGDSSNSDFKKIFDRFRDYGIIPLFSDYLETLVYNDRLEIIYYESNRSCDLSRDIISYKKICVPSIFKNISKLDENIEGYLSLYLNSIFNSPLNVVIKPSKVGRPRSKEVLDGLIFLNKTYSAFKMFKKPSSYIYGNINGLDVIFSIFENNGRYVCILPVDYSEEYIGEYLKIATPLADYYCNIIGGLDGK